MIFPEKSISYTLCNDMLEKIVFKLIKKIHRLETGYYLKKITSGENVKFRHPIEIRKPENIYLADSVSINKNCTFLAHGRISIGKNTMIGPNVTIITVNHDYRLEGKKSNSAHIISPVTIGENVWIGANTLILPGITIGANAVVAGGSVVTKAVGTGEIVGGNPASFIKKRFHLL